MLIFLLNFIFSENCINSQLLNETKRTYLINDLNFFISFCIFKRTHTFQGSGSIIYFHLKGINSSIINCLFSNCSSTSEGGAIYINCNINGAQSLIKNTCANNCWTSNTEHQFALICIYNNINFQNYVEQISYYKCSPFYDNGNIPFRLHYGNISAKSINSSFNNLRYSSGIAFLFGSISNLIYLNIYNNNVSIFRCLTLYGGNNNIIKNLNLIKNNSPSEGVIYINEGNWIIFNSVLLNNYNTLFYKHSGSFQIENSNIYHNDIMTYGIILTLNIKLELTETFFLKFYYCYFFKTSTLKLRIQFLKFVTFFLS